MNPFALMAVIKINLLRRPALHLRQPVKNAGKATTNLIMSLPAKKISTPQNRLASCRALPPVWRAKAVWLNNSLFATSRTLCGQSGAFSTP